jgi:hypothetical protein
MINGGWRLLSHPIRSRPAFEWIAYACNVGLSRQFFN